MKILWFTNTPSLASGYYGCEYAGGGWISGLESAIHEHTEIELAEVFLTNSKNSSVVLGKTLYFPVLRRENSIQKLINRHFNRVSTKKYLKDYLKIIDEFKPDIIQIFGTENGFSSLCGNTKVPVCIHLQGILSGIEQYFLPENNSKLDLLRYSSLMRILKGTSLLHIYMNFRRRAKRELRCLPLCHYYLGRTTYDKTFIMRHAPNATYFHCDELLRNGFYETKGWINPVNEKFIILTINNGEIYKGIDIVLKTASVLKEAGLIFEWRIAGVDQSNEVLHLFEGKTKLSHKDLSIKCLGKLNAEHIIEQMKESNLFVHTSKVDNSPNSVCEAMLLGMPVIAFNVGGVSSLIDSDCGILINRVESSELAKEILQAVSSPDHLEKIGRSARLVASDRHNPAKVLANLQKAYQKIIQKV